MNGTRNVLRQEKTTKTKIKATQIGKGILILFFEIKYLKGEKIVEKT